MKSPFAGRYTIERELGRGGMATVYRARDIRHDRAVALKVLHRELAASMGAERFAREIRLLAGLHHPHILPLFDSGEYEGAVFYVVPCVEGESLRRRLEREKQLQLDEAIRITREVADALDHAHRNGVIHRDIKPENILLEEGHAIVADFGVARAVTRSVDESQTTAGMAVGTPAYMSPEQASGERELDGRSDQYSLACVLYEMLAGIPPFSGTTPRATIARRFTEPPPSLRRERNVPESLDRAIQRALSPVPADRFPDVRAFAKAIEPVPPAGPRVYHRSGVALGAVALAVALGLLFWRPDSVGGDALDSSLHVVLPFLQHSDVSVVDGDDAERLMGRALARWSDLRFVDPLRSRDAANRQGGVKTLRDALAIARRLGAGRLVWGEVWGHPDSADVRTALYDVAKGRDVRSARATVGSNPIHTHAKFAALADSVLGMTSAATLGTGLGATTISEALRWFDAGHEALARWDLAAAEREFRAAAERDPQFAQAALWTAQVMAWAGREPATWRAPASRAVLLRDRLSARDQVRAAGLLALAESRFGDACHHYRALLQRDSTDFAAHYGLGDCQVRDPVVVRDASSPSGWHFRGSLHSGLRAYARAMDVLPSFHRAREAPEPARLPVDYYPTERGRLRRGYSVAGDTVRFAAVPGLVADTLSTIPYPIEEVFNHLPGRWPATNAAAIVWSREQLRRIAEVWVQAFPRSVTALEARSAALESMGELVDAAADARSARLVAVDGETKARLAHNEVRLAVKQGHYERAASVADSVLEAYRTPSVAEAYWLVGLAALTGRVHTTSALLQMRADDSTFAFSSLGERVTAPRPVARAALALLAYVSFPEPRDSVRVLAASVPRLVDAWVEPARRERVRRAVMTDPTIFGLWEVRPRAALEVSAPAPLHRMQQAFARGDSSAVRVIADSQYADRAPRQGLGGIVPDMAYQEALVLLAIGDSARASRSATVAVESVPHAPRWLLLDVHRAAAIPLAMRLRALLAAHAGDSATARRWATAALTLWQRADAELRPSLEPLRVMGDTSRR
jgi:tRNA A-37 threonylcarbamoyl transferase component Bud32/tetratricopeptide (TPR) repeat protein